MASNQELHSSFSLIVDDVDSQTVLKGHCESDAAVLLKSISQSSISSAESALDSPTGSRERIKQIQVEAETRRGEFARLLEEHAQVVRKLKIMEAEEQLSSRSGSVVAAAHA